MVTAAARRLGEAPTAREVAEEALALVRELTARVAALEADRDVEDEVDGGMPAPLTPNWRPLKAACAILGFSASGLRKAIRRDKGGRWWQYSGARLLVNVETAPRKQGQT